MNVRARRPRLPIVRAVVLGVLVVGVLFGWDASRQPTGGSDWLLVGRQHLVGEPPPLDFDRALVFWFTSVGSVGCPSRLDGIRIDLPRRRVEASFSRGFTLGCDDGAVPDSFLVSVGRDRLPEVAYRVDLLGPQPLGAANGALDVTP